MTDSPLTPADLQRWRELADAASPGPWLFGRYHTDNGQTFPYVIFILDENGWPDHDSTRMLNEDAAFIAAARDAVPRLLAAYAAAHDSAGAWASRAAASGLQVEACIALLTRAAAHIRWLHSCIEDEVSTGEAIALDPLLAEMGAVVAGWGATQGKAE